MAGIFDMSNTEKALGWSNFGLDAATQIANGLFGYFGQKEQRKWEEQMYERQLADNHAMYERQLADSRANTADERSYNSPVRQAARLQAAGINPQLQNVDNLQSAAAATPQAQPSPNRQFNLASFLPQLALNLEPLMQVVGSMQQIRSAELDNKLKEANLADEIISGLFSEREIDWFLHGFPEIAGFSKEEIDELNAMGIKLKDIITSPGKVSGSYTESMLNKIRNAYSGYGYNDRKSRKLARMALERVRNRGRLANEYGNERSFIDSLFGITQGKSQYGFDPHGNASEPLQRLYEIMYDSAKASGLWEQESIGYERSSRQKSSAQAESLGFFWEAIRDGLNSDKWYNVVGSFFAVALIQALGQSSFGASVSRSYVTK